MPLASYVGVEDHLGESWKDGGRVLFCNDDMQFKPNYMTQLLLLRKFEYGGRPIFKVVLEC